MEFQKYGMYTCVGLKYKPSTPLMPSPEILNIPPCSYPEFEKSQSKPLSDFDSHLSQQGVITVNKVQ